MSFKGRRWVKLAIAVIFLLSAGFWFLKRYCGGERKNWNVLLITVDALRADHLGCYGYGKDITPHIDKLAKGGALFQNAVSQGPFTAPSLPSLMTSTYGYVHGVRGFGDMLNPSLKTLAEILREEGYLTGAVCAIDFFLDILGLKRGFQWVSTGDDKRADWITEEAMGWIKENKNRRFFLWIHYFDPHQPYDPPPDIKREVRKEVSRPSSPLLPVVKKDPRDPDIYGAFGGISEKAVIEGRRDKEFYLALYDGEVKFVDREIGRLIKFLKESGLLSQTFIILTADHGEAFGEHNLYFTHGHILYEEILHVPLILYGEGVIPEGKVITEVVGLIDILPTVLDFLGIKSRGRIEGKSLLPVVLKGKAYPSRIIYAELWEKEEDGRRLISVRKGDWKLIYNVEKNTYQLYNLKEDPKEVRNLAGEEKKKFKELRKFINKYLTRRKKYGYKGKEKELEEEIKEKLKGLGYLQ